MYEISHPFFIVKRGFAMTELPKKYLPFLGQPCPYNRILSKPYKIAPCHFELPLWGEKSHIDKDNRSFKRGLL